MNKIQKWLQKTVTGMAVVMIPVGGLYVVNLPYSAIRSPIAQKAPLLLLPSQIVVENNFKQAVNLVEQSDQLINNSTSFVDFD
ncbi:MAG: hypothetical protein IGQ45_02410 [Cyanobacterium sp. T60_A2020_053]|nr:hypothetical protein [Cyanobacterium sp. T60_A2020_053]